VGVAACFYADCYVARVVVTLRLPTCVTALPELRAKMEETHNLARGGEAGDPEVHVIGEIVGGEGFESGCACKWVIQAGDSWKCLEGNTGGQTHVIYKSTVSKIDVWAHPIDVHYVAGSLDVSYTQVLLCVRCSLTLSLAWVSGVATHSAAGVEAR